MADGIKQDVWMKELEALGIIGKGKHNDKGRTVDEWCEYAESLGHHISKERMRRFIRYAQDKGLVQVGMRTKRRIDLQDYPAPVYFIKTAGAGQSERSR